MKAEIDTPPAPPPASTAAPAADKPKHADLLGTASPDLSRSGAKRVHYPALDGLRGLAILMVLACHCFQQAPALDGPHWVFGAMGSHGSFGVDLFFVLSGFLITGILYDSRALRHRFRNFYARRFLRIFPLYFGVLAFAATVLLALRWGDPTLFYSSHAARMVWHAQPFLWTYTENLRMAAGHSAWCFGHFWSLCVEEQFYLVWPLVILLLPRRAIIGVCISLIFGALVLRLVMSACGAGFLTVYFFTPARLDPLAAGALVAMLLRAPDTTIIPRLVNAARRFVPVVLVGAIVLFVGFPLASLGTRTAAPELSGFFSRAADGRWCADFQYSAMALLFSGVLLLLVAPQGSARLKQLFSWKPLRAIGGYSYGIYVIHYPILGLLRLAEAPGRPLHGLETHGVPGALAYVALAIAISFGLAFASFHLYEKRFLKLKKYFPESGPRAATVRK